MLGAKGKERVREVQDAERRHARRRGRAQQAAHVEYLPCHAYRPAAQID